MKKHHGDADVVTAASYMSLVISSTRFIQSFQMILDGSWIIGEGQIIYQKLTLIGLLMLLPISILSIVSLTTIIGDMYLYMQRSVEAVLVQKPTSGWWTTTSMSAIGDSL